MIGYNGSPSRSLPKECGLLEMIRHKKNQSHFILAVLVLCAAALGPRPAHAQSAPPAPAKKQDVSGASLKPAFLEPWDTPSLAGSALAGVKDYDEIVGVTDTIDNTYTSEVTRVQWRPADPIDLYIIKPVGVKNPPVILYLYSYPFETDRFLNHDFCKFLVRNGYAAIGFASALTGQRYHSPRPMKEWFVSQLPESLATSAHDVQMILNYMASRGDVDMTRVGMFGDGSGASIAILAAAADPRIKTLDLLDPWADWPVWTEKSSIIPPNELPNFEKTEWQAAAAPLDPLKWLPRLKTQSIRLQLVKNIPVTPVSVEDKIAAAVRSMPNVQVLSYESPQAFRSAVAAGTGFDWIKAKLQFSVVPDYSAAGQGSQKGPSSASPDLHP